MKFIKDGKVVSHLLKAYRGEILKIIAQNDIKLWWFYEFGVENLKLEEIKEQKLKQKLFIYNIKVKWTISRLLIEKDEQQKSLNIKIEYKDNKILYCIDHYKEGLI